MRPILALTLLLAAMDTGQLHAQDFWVRSHGPSPGHIMALSVTPTGQLLAARQGEMGVGGSVLRSPDGGGSWEQVNGGLLDTNVVSLLAMRDGTILAGIFAWFGQGGICLYRSSDEGNAWSRSDSGLAGAGMVMALAEDSTGNLFCSADNGLSGSLRAVLRSTDHGVSWLPTAAQIPPNAPVNAFLVNGDNILFAAAYSGIYRSSNQGATWDTLESGLFSSLALHPGGMLFAGMGYGGGVYRSADTGNTWVRTSFDSGAVHALVVTPEGVLFVGTEAKGVFWSSDNGDSWQRNNTGLPNVWIWSLLFAPNGHVFAGTGSGGIFRTTGPVTSVDAQGPLIPKRHILYQNYPNPFNPTTTIVLELSVSSEIRLAVYDILGREVSVLLNERRDAGVHRIRFDASGLSSGTYMYRMTAGSSVMTGRMMFLR